LLFVWSFLAGVAAVFWERGRIYLLTLLLVLSGWTGMIYHTAIISPDDLRDVAGNQPVQASVRGILQASPIPRIFERQNHELWHSSAVIDVQQIRLTNGWQPAFGKIIAFTPGILSSEFFGGQVVEVYGILDTPPGPLADGLFNSREFYQHNGIYFRLRTQSTTAWAIAPEGQLRSLPLAERFSIWARKTLALGLGHEDASLRLIWTLALDWKAPLTETVEEPFLRAGTYHIFAVDGLRIGLLAGIGIAFLRVLRLPRGWCGMLVLPVIWFYVGLTGWPASAVRAAIMISIIIAGWALRRPTDLVNSLFAAALVILLWDPQQLFQAGFQLSFAVVLCIALLLRPIQNLFQSWIFKKDPFLPAALQPRWPPALHASAIFVIDTCALSLAAWLGSMPLAAAYFHLFTPVSVPANILVVPITALALMSSVASLLTGSWLPGLAILFNHSSWFFMRCIIQLSHWAANWSPGAWNVTAPSTVTFVLYYAVLFPLLSGWVFRSKFKWVMAAGIPILSVCWLAQHIKESRGARLHLLPLNGGAAIFADNSSGNRSVLFDCGNTSSTESVVKPFLCAQGVNRLDALALTAGHVQDVGGAEVVLTNFNPKTVFLNSAHDRSPAYHDVVQAITQTAHCQALTAGNDAEGWSVLHPNGTNQFPDADDNALVFQREINGHSVLLLSCLGRRGQDSLLARYPELRADIVVAGLPTTDEPLCEPLFNTLRPKLVVIIDSQFPATRRASDKLRTRLTSHGVPVLFCRDTCALKLTLWRGRWELADVAGTIRETSTAP
jgi:competence protein ComEC